MVEFFFHLVSKWSKWCTQTLHPFCQILKIFLRIGASIVVPPSDNFQICFSVEKGFSSPKKTLQFASKSVYKRRRDLLLKNATASLAIVMQPSVIYEKKVKNITLQPLTPTCVVRFPPNFA